MPIRYLPPHHPSCVFCTFAQSSEEPIGEGGGISLTGCTTSFDGLPGCEIRGTTFFGNAVAKKGGAVMTANGDGDDPSRVEFHSCVISNNTAGDWTLLDDPQGEGGAIVVGDMVTTLLAGCLAEKNWAGKKVPLSQRIHVQVVLSDCYRWEGTVCTVAGDYGGSKFRELRAQ